MFDSPEMAQAVKTPPGLPGNAFWGSVSTRPPTNWSFIQNHARNVPCSPSASTGDQGGTAWTSTTLEVRLLARREWPSRTMIRALRVVVTSPEPRQNPSLWWRITRIRPTNTSSLGCFLSAGSAVLSCYQSRGRHNLLALSSSFLWAQQHMSSKRPCEIKIQPNHMGVKYEEWPRRFFFHTEVPASYSVYSHG